MYLCAAYLLDRLWEVPRPLPVRVGPLLCVAVVAFGLWQTPRVAEPLVDADREGRWLLDYLHTHADPKPVAVYTDSWRVMFIVARYGRSDRAWIPRGVPPDSKRRKVKFLSGAPPGVLVVTGGATLPWYSGIDLIVSLSRLDFEVPRHWTLVAERHGKVTPWRAEPLRIWSVGSPSADGAAAPPPA